MVGKYLILVNGFDGSVVSIPWKYNYYHQYIATGSENGSVHHWRIIDGDGYNALLEWSPPHCALVLFDVSFKGDQDLSMVNWKPFHQRGTLNSKSS